MQKHKKYVVKAYSGGLKKKKTIKKGIINWNSPFINFIALLNPTLIAD